VFREAFEGIDKDVIKLNLLNEIDSYALAKLDPKTMQIETKAGMKVRRP
jgi:hypothetical protein